MGNRSPSGRRTEELSATYTGLLGHRYAFYSVARDLVGNEEAPHTEADTTTRIGGGEACDGDCNSDGRVSINELVTAVRVALAAAPLDQCAAADCRSTGSVSIDCLVRAVIAALSDCP